MHEMSVALEVCRMTEEQVGRDALDRVVTVGLEVGDRAGLVVESLQFCLDALLEQPPFGGARSVVERREGDVLRLAWLEIDDGDVDDEEAPAAGDAAARGAR